MSLSEKRVWVSCSSWERARHPMGFLFTEKGEYGPLNAEYEIISDLEASRRCLEPNILGFVSHDATIQKIRKLLERRTETLTTLRATPEVRAFLTKIGVMIEEERSERELLEAEIGPAEEEESVREGDLESSEDEFVDVVDEQIESKGARYQEEVAHRSLIEALREEVQLRNNVEVREAIEVYIKAFLDILDWLVDQSGILVQHGIPVSQLNKLVSTLFQLDCVVLTDSRKSMTTQRSIVVPLDISPLRLHLCLCQATSEEFNHLMMHTPPMSCLIHEDSVILMKPYRTFENHVIMIPVPRLRRDPREFRDDVRNWMNNFREHIGPLITSLKALLGIKKEIAPAVVRSKIVKVVRSYLRHNPFAAEHLSFADLGCGNGGLMIDLVEKLVDEPELPDPFFSIMFNDILPDAGRAFKRATRKERLIQRTTLRFWIGDMLDLIPKLHEEAQTSHQALFDIVFVNRVFDLYGGYGVFRYAAKDLSPDLTRRLPEFSSTTAEVPPLGEVINTPLVSFVGSLPFTKLWRALRFVIDGWTDEELGGTSLCFLPGVNMDMIHNFFGGHKQGVELIEKLTELSELVFVSVYPGSEQSVFPNLRAEGVHVVELPPHEPFGYAAICISRDKTLLERLLSDAQSP